VADCPVCMRNVAETLAAKAADALCIVPDHEHDDCGLCDRESDPDANAVDDLAEHLRFLLGFIAKRRAG